MKKSVTLDRGNRTVIINELTIQDPTLYSILKDIDPSNQEGFIQTAIVIGAIGLRNMVVAENVDYVEKEFKQVLHELEMQRKDLDIKMNEVFNIHDSSSPLGKLVGVLAEYFDADSGAVANLLDVNNPSSPLYQFRSDIISKLEALNTAIAVQEKYDEVVAGTPLKGGKFEENIESELIRITNHYGDRVEYVGDIRGRRGKKGDFVIYVGGVESSKIVVECKDSFSYTHRDVSNEIEAAMENRKARFGIFLFNSEDQIPKQMRPTRITPNTIITAYENNGLYFAYRVARIVLEQKVVEKAQVIPIDDIQNQLNEIRDKCSMIKGMQSKITTIENAAQYLRDRLNELEDGVDICLSKIRDCLVNQ